MDPRILIAVVVGLVLVAFGGFYFALGPRSSDALLPAAVADRQRRPAPPRRWRRCRHAACAAAPPPMATPASIEAEIVLSEHAELQAL